MKRKNPKTLKAISPLVATIMLIAFTMIVAGILATWATRFAQTQKSQIEFCMDASAYIQGGSYDPAADELRLVLYNNGQVPLNFIVLLTYSDQNLHPSLIEKYPETFNVSEQTITTLLLTSIEDDLKEVTVQSDVCPGAQDLLQKRWIKGLGS